ncbi:MAG: hypothetical protein WC661_17655 [Opitutaceae bacterium]|jgi:ElaB/YqjD/DUF883 family membrane-anchored ribosome-binding protein
MKSTKDTAHTPKEILHDLQALVVEAETMLADSASEHTGEVVENLRARFHAAQERFSELYEGARKKVAAGAKCTDEAIRANPYQSIAIAAGVGLLIGVLVGRRSK